MRAFLTVLAFCAAMFAPYATATETFPWRGYMILCANETCMPFQTRDLFETQEECRRALAVQARRAYDTLVEELPNARVRVEADCFNDQDFFNA